MKVYSEERFRPRVQTVNMLPSMTVQADVLKSDIKHVLAKYRQVGILEHMRSVDLQFRDVSEFEDFSDLMFQSAEARRVFMGLPSKVREVFNHDVAEWLDAAHDPAKLEALRPELEKLGVLKPEEVPAVTPLVVPQAGDRRRSVDGRFTATAGVSAPVVPGATPRT